jgi:hypothetical protein
MTLDFSQEPGTIVTKLQIAEASPNWATSKKPLSRMLEAFFDSAIRGYRDERLGTSVGLKAAYLSVEMLPLYNAAQSHWLVKRLLEGNENDRDDVRYALREMVVSADSHAIPVSEDELSRLLQEIKSCVNDTLRREQFVAQPIEFIKSVLVNSRMYKRAP